MASAALITLKMAAAGFRIHWKHCDQVANYLALVARTRLDRSPEYENLLSTVLNELLELVFRRNAAAGEIALVMSEREGSLDIHVDVPVGESDRAFYLEMAARLAREDLDHMREELALAPPPTANLTAGLLELASVYGAVLTATDADEGRVRLRIAFDAGAAEGA